MALALTSPARRQRLLRDARGRVLDVGAGSVLNLPHYPPAAERVVVLEPDASRRERLLKWVANSPVPVEVHEAAIIGAPFADDTFDTVVSTDALCAVPDRDIALGEMRRVLKPDGRLLFLERAARRRPDPVAAIRDAGFAVTACDRSAERSRIPLLRSPMAAGIAQPRHSPAA